MLRKGKGRGMESKRKERGEWETECLDHSLLQGCNFGWCGVINKSVCFNPVAVFIGVVHNCNLKVCYIFSCVYTVHG